MPLILSIRARPGNGSYRLHGGQWQSGPPKPCTGFTPACLPLGFSVPAPHRTCPEMKTRNETTRDVCRGTLRLLADLDYFGLVEVPLANGRRADIASIGRTGDIWIIEIKSGIADFQADQKWHEYLDYCDRLSFAVAPDFPQGLIPPEAGLIIADGFNGAIIREAGEIRLGAARRRAMTLKMARLASARLLRSGETGWTWDESVSTSSPP